MKFHPVQIVVKCEDCGVHVATLMVEIEKPLSQTSFQQRHRLLHEVLAEAIQDGTISEETLYEHNLGAMIGTADEVFRSCN